MIKLTMTARQRKALIRKSLLAERLGDLNSAKKCLALDLKVDHQLSLEEIGKLIGRSAECIRNWFKDFIAFGIESLKITARVGRPGKLDKSQKASIKSMIENGPQSCGFMSGIWTSAMIAALIHREFGVKYCPKYIPQLLKSIGLSYQKSKFEGAKRCESSRSVWKEETWPKIVERARKTNAMVLFGDESSFAMWGSLAHTWAPKGVQPVVQTSGNRKSYKMFGFIDYFSGKLFYKGTSEKLNGESYIDFIKEVRAKTDRPLIIIQDNSSYHSSKLVKDYLATSDRISVYNLPTYSPDLNPIEKIWKEAKRLGTHNVFFPDFGTLIRVVEGTMRRLSEEQDKILRKFEMYRKLES